MPVLWPSHGIQNYPVIWDGQSQRKQVSLAIAAGMHRQSISTAVAFDGRNYEYYSEDSFLSGKMCGAAVSGEYGYGCILLCKTSDLQ